MSTQMVVGLLAHVDAGKTTLGEALLYQCGAIRTAGRVDHGDAHLDFEPLERNRGITIFSKQALLRHGNTTIALLDTPGHVDFSAEAERTLQVLDCAVLVVAANEGVRGHTKTLWRLLERYSVPTVLFVNKTDLAGSNPSTIMEGVRAELDPGCMDYASLCDPGQQEVAALTDELALEEYVERGCLADATIKRLVAERKIFPCLFGSALKMEGTLELLRALESLSPQHAWSSDFGARVYKVSHGAKGERICWLKVTGGTLRAKQMVEGIDASGSPWSQKVDQLRLYAGHQFEVVQEVGAGSVCAATGLTRAMPGDGLGGERSKSKPMLVPVLDYRVVPLGCDVHDVYMALLVLADEDPLLGTYWLEELQEVRVRLMGVIQQEIIQQTLADRWGLDVRFDTGAVLYKETIQGSVHGIGHFEPLRHYAEVHLRISAAERGSGVTCSSACSEDVLARNWQRLILTHVMEREHKGVLVGAPLTDVHIALVAGRAHPKHTGGGDFRQATYRAIRQGLMQARSTLLEPWYRYELEVPQDKVGRALSDLQRMSATLGTPTVVGDLARLEGVAPVSTMRDYSVEVRSYTRGSGSLSLEFAGYDHCHDAESVIESFAYDAANDLQNTPHSVFCSHGAGYTVPWDQVADHAHVMPEGGD